MSKLSRTAAIAFLSASIAVGAVAAGLYGGGAIAEEQSLRRMSSAKSDRTASTRHDDHKHGKGRSALRIFYL